MSATLFRGQAIRCRADVQRTLIERQPSTWWGALGLQLGRLLLWTVRWSLISLFLIAWGALYVPAAGAVVLLLLVALVVAGSPGVVAVAFASAAGAWAWDRWSPTTWQRWVVSRSSRFWRRIRYRFTWDDVLAASGVKVTDAAHRVVVPRLLWVHLGHYADTLVVQLCPGVTVDSLATKAEYLISEWGALEVKVQRHPKRRGWVTIRVVLRDLLAEEPASQTDAVNLTRLRLGRRDDGRPWLLNLAGRHLLVAGSSGAGKGSIVTGLLWALAPAIREGWVRCIGIDPKGGMEFGMYGGLFHMLAMDSEAELVAALEAAVVLVEERCRELRGKERKHSPSVDSPFYVLFVDEIASLTAYIVDRELKERAKAALGRLLTKGRAPGLAVVGCVQDPRKEVVEYRNLFTLKLALRLDSKSEVAMVLGDQAHDRGARCEEISADTQGIGFAVDDEADHTPVRVRADWHSDAEMSWLAAEYASPTHEDVPELVRKTGKRQEKAS